MDDAQSLDETRWIMWATMYYGATGHWPTRPATTPPDDTKPRENHVRDAVLNNLTD